jgi:putative tryptophan/tyrosine transport system substrate-binding protein
MKRRTFIGLIGGAAAAWPLGVRGQLGGKLPIIGFLGANTAETQVPWTAAFLKRLHELGWKEGRNIVIEYRWAEGRFNRSSEIIAEFIRLNVDVLIMSGTANVLAAKRATSAIPIVFALAGDPVSTGLVSSLARPGANVTGLSIEGPDLAGKRIELLREVVPDMRRLGFLVRPDNPPIVAEMRSTQRASEALAVEVVVAEIRKPEDIEPTFAMLKDHADGLYVPLDPLMTTYRKRIFSLALERRLPTISDTRDYAAAGGLMSYGANIPDLWRRAAEIVDKILHGIRPADIPVEQPRTFDLVIDLKTAKALGLEVPRTLLATSNEVIE